MTEHNAGAFRGHDIQLRVEDVLDVPLILVLLDARQRLRDFKHMESRACSSKHRRVGQNRNRYSQYQVGGPSLIA